MNLRVIKAGVLDTIQDMGRHGWQHLGINPGGAMDRLSAQVANILAGNEPGEAVIELHFPASAFFFEQPALVAISGADFSATVNGEVVPHLQPLLISKFSILQFHGVRAGARAYLAVNGGFDIPTWQGSRSTHVKSSVGGLNGRALQKDDEIRLRSVIDFTSLAGNKEFEVLPWKADDRWEESHTGKILVLPGHEWTSLNDRSKELFLQQSYAITSRSDRMGYHLRSGALSVSSAEDVVSSPVNFGTVQLLPNGQLIILMADHQTTGGYPRLAHAITAHHARLAQMKVGEAISFRFTDQHTAEDLLVKQQQHLRQLHYACSYRLHEYLNK